jgi:hypothetical protein
LRALRLLAALGLAVAASALAADGLAPFATSTAVPGGAGVFGTPGILPLAALALSITPTQTPTPSDSPTVTVTPICSPTATPTNPPYAPPEELPQAPGQPQGAFALVTGPAAPKPLVRLHWDAAEPGTHVIRGYRVSRRSDDSTDWEVRRGAEDLDALEWEDLAEVGKRFDYRVQAVDFLGRPGAASPVLSMDLAHLPASILAPPAPLGVTATSKRDTVLLRWQAMLPWLAPLSDYRVYRALTLSALADADPLTMTGTSLELTPPAQVQDLYFAVQAQDQAGRLSPLSLTVSGRATGVLPPVMKGLTATAKVEKAVLNWLAPDPGTAPLSAFLVQRRQGEDGDRWRKLVPLAPGTLSYSEGLDGGQEYLYRVSAVDAEGNTGPWAFVAVSPTVHLLNKSQVVLMPTAYTNDPLHDRGINLGVLFDFYVGSLYETYSSPLTGKQEVGVFQPLQIGTITTDLKYALLDDRGLVPGLAVGLYTAALISFGSGNASTVGVSSNTGGLSTLGDVYAVMSKRFWPGEPGAVVHLGLLYGKLSDYLTSDPTPVDWRLTIRHLTPGGDFPDLFTRFVDPKLDATVGESPHLAFLGLQFPFTLPLGFTRWHSALRTELMVPLGWGADYPASASGITPPTTNPANDLPYMINVHLDNLPLFGFEFGFLEYPGGMQVIAFYHIPDLSWNW